MMPRDALRLLLLGASLLSAVYAEDGTSIAPTASPAPCFICGEGNEVLNADGIVDLGGETISCGELDLAGGAGA
jgi:hypothetical protein